MLMAHMAEYADVAVAAPLPIRVGAAYSIGNATCRTSTAYLDALPARALLAPMALRPGSLVSFFGVLLLNGLEMLFSRGGVATRRIRLAMWGSSASLSVCTSCG